MKLVIDEPVATKLEYFDKKQIFMLIKFQL
ncbi:MAG: hypothetical protein JWP57_2141, partial [Spirosoma sp.]|nr:hypothetical protein [Spirosoma sp.]